MVNSLMKYEILATTESHIEGFRDAVDVVAKERKYLAFLEGFPLETSRTFVLDNIQKDYPHFVAVSNGKVIGWCDISPLNRSLFKHAGSLGIGVIAQYRGQGVGENLMRAALQQS